MADYRDLLRRAIEALPENNGNARRQVYDKARAALRKQLDAIQPVLPSREKTHHRLQLEECIREVEQEATERMLSGLSQLEHDTFGTHAADSRESGKPGDGDDAPSDDGAESDPPAAPAETDTDEASPEPESVAEPADMSEPAPEHTETPEPTEPESAAVEMAEDEPANKESAQADASGPTFETTSQASVSAFAAEPAPIQVSAPVEMSIDAVESSDVPLTDPSDTADTAVQAAAAALAGVAPEPVASPAEGKDGPEPKKPLLSRFTSKVSAYTPGSANSAKGEAEVASPAMSVEREVELDADTGDGGDGDPQTAIDHAIAVLDREASGDSALGEATLDTTDPDLADLGFARAEAEDEGGGSPALTIFLVLVLLLLAGAGGASYWAWREGYLDLSNLFGNGVAVVSEANTTTDIAAATPPAETRTEVQTGAETVETSRPGNTMATPDVVETPDTGLEQADATATGDTASDALALAPTNGATTPTMDGTDANSSVGNTVAPVTTDAADAAAAIAEPVAADDKTEDRLPVAEDTTAAPAAVADQAAASPDMVSDGSQSLLLEASDQANAGAVPFSGTVEWTRGVDELGQPTLEAKANIPARNMSVDLLIRKNSDPSLPASHLIEIDFTVSDSFIGGGIARIAGILMKNEELVQGVPLVGASARVVGNNFLFALSASAQDVTANNALLKSRKWIDLAIIYSTGKQAILTLEKDDAATALFDNVLAAWNPVTTPTTPPATEAPQQ